MEITVPSYYERFHCLAGQCRDNCCCTGWQIVIDPDTLEYYRHLPEPQRGRILAGLTENEEGETIIRPRDGRCPFLTGERLCGLVLELGEEHIGEICALHPRYRAWYPGRLEMGVGLCCEEAARLILSDSAPAEFYTYLTDQADEEGEDVPLYPALLNLRERLFAAAQDRSRPLRLRLAEILRLAHAAQEAVNRGELPDTQVPPSPLPASSGDGRNVLRALADAHREMEVLEAPWGEALSRLSAQLDALDWSGFQAAAEAWAWEYEHLTVYLLFRYFLPAVWDGTPLLAAEQVVGMVLAIAALGALAWQEGGGSLSAAERWEIARQYSKEVEYSEDNLELLREAFLFAPALSLPALLGLLEGSGTAAADAL